MFRTQNIIKRYFIWMSIMLLSHYASAQSTLYSIGSSSASSPATSANWSLTSGGAPAGITPSVTTTLVFDANSDATTLNGAISCANIVVEAGYTDTIDVLSSSTTFTITGSLNMQAGCLRFNNNPVNINTGVTIGANATFIAPNNTIRLGGLIDMQGTWVHNNGTVKIYSQPTFKGNMTFNNMEFPLGVVTVDTNSVVTVAGFMDIQNLGNMVINGPGEIHLHGDLYYRNKNSQACNGTIRFVGTGDQYLYGNHSLYGTLPSLIVDKPSGTLFFKDTIGGVRNPIRLLQGTLDASTYQSTVSFNSSLTLKESIPLYHVFITPANSAFNIDSNADMQINGNLTINANGFNTLSINGPGEIWLKGNLYNKSGSQGSGGNGTIRFNGVGEQVLLGNHNLIYGSLPKLIIDKPSGTLFFKDTIGGTKNPIQLVQGTLDASTYQSTLSICGSMTFKENMSLHHVIINGNTTNINIDTTKLLTINGDLKLTGSGGNYPIFINGPGEIQLKGNLFSHSLGNNGSGGSGAIRFVGENDQTLFGNKIFSNSSLPSLIVDKPSGTLFLRDSILGIKNSLRYVRGGFDATTYQSTVYFNGSVRLRENLTFHNIIFRPANSSISIDSNVAMQVDGNLTIESIHNTPIYINGPGEIRLKGSLINNNICYGDGGNGTIRFIGSGNQILNGNHNILYGSLPQLIIDKPSGTLFLKDTIGGVKNPIRLLQGTLDASTYNSTVAIVGNYSQKESISFNHLYINPGNSSLNIDTNKVLQVNGDLTIANASGWSQLINGPGEIQLKGNLYNNNLYTTGSGGNGTIRFTGTTDQIFRGNHHLTYGSLPQIIIDKPSGTLFLKDTIGGVKNPIRLLNGNVDASTFQSTVGFFGTFNLKDNLSLHHVVFSPVNSSFNIDTNKVLQVNGNLTIFNMGGNNQAINGPGVMHINGNIYNNNTSYGSGGTGTLIVNGAANQTITGQNAEGVGKLPSILIRKPSGTLQISNKVSTSGSFTVEKGNGTFTDTTGTVFMYGTNGSFSNESDSGYVQIPNVKLLANSQLSGKLHVTKQIDLGTYTLALNNFGVQNDNPDSTTSLKYSTTGGFVTNGSLNGSYSQRCLLNNGYKVPFRKADNTTITPITFRLDSATTTDSTYFTVSTYGTDPSVTPNNRPLPLGLEAILDSNGHDASGFVLDRYWNCKVRNTASFTSAQLKVSFLTSEYGSPNTISSLTNLKAYGYSGANEIENIGISGSVSAISTSLQLKSATNDGITLSTLPINRGGGMGNAWDEIVCSSNALLCVKITVTPGAKGSGQATLLADIKRGQGPFTYIWSNGATSSTIENVNAGYYEITVTDAAGNQVAVQQFGGQQVSLDTTISILDSLNELIAMSPDSFMVDSNGNKFMLYGLAYGKNRLGADGNGTVSYEWEKGSDFTGAVGMIHDLSFDYGYGMMVLPMDSPTGSGTQKLVVAGEEQTLLGTVEDNKPLRLDIVQDETGVKFFKNKLLVHAITKEQLQQKGGTLLDLSPTILFMKPQTKLKGWMTDFKVPTPSNQSRSVCIQSEIDQAVVKSKDINWVYTETYSIEEDASVGEIISASKQFYDNFGRPTQSQTYVSTDNNLVSTYPCAIFATQNVYDNFGRKVLTSLPAPTGQTVFEYKDNFLTNQAVSIGGNEVVPSENYNVTHFDEINGSVYTATNQSQYQNTIENPLPVRKDQIGTVGWYYSANNTFEPNIDRTDFPYSRVEYYNQPDGGVKRASGVGDAFRMGVGHEVRSFTMLAGQELFGIYGFQNELNGKIIKSISVDQDGKESVVFSDLEGHTLATCLSGKDNGANVFEQISAFTIPAGEYRDIHIPDGGNWQFSLIPGASGWTPDAIEDINQNFKTIPSITGPGYYRLKANAGGSDGFVFVTTNYHHFALYYYDRVGHLISSVPPLGVDYSKDANNQFKREHSMLATSSTNTLGQTNWKRSPDEGHTEYLYRKDGQVRFSQNDKQIWEGKFSYTNYDATGRPIEVGEYEGFRGETTTDLTSLYQTGKGILIPSHNQQFLVFSIGLTSPNTIWANTLVDNVDGIADNKSTNVTRFFYDEPQVINGRTQRFTKGRISYNARFSVGSNANFDYATWYSYDETGKIEWTVQFIRGEGYKTIDYEYDASGNLLHTIYQKTNKADYFSHDYEYDKQFRLKTYKTRHYSNTGFSAPDQTKTHAKYSYYLHGPLKRVVLGDNLQGIDYTYTVDGKLKAINDPNFESGHDLDRGVGSSPKQDVFGMTLDYFPNDYKGGNPIYVRNKPGTYNGQINAIRWRTRSEDLIPKIPAHTGDNGFVPDELLDENIYEIKYNKQGWMTEAKFGMLKESQGNMVPEKYWTNNQYKEQISQYDLNGNIKYLTRTNESGVVIDNLTYNYDANTNKLASLSDALSTSTVGDIVSSTYTYNAIGQMTDDQGQNQYLHYNVYGKVDTVFEMASGQKRIKAVYEYDANNYRTKKEVFTYLTGQTFPSHNSTTVYFNDASGNPIDIRETEYALTLNLGNVLTKTATSKQTEKQLFGAGRVGVFYKNLPLNSYGLPGTPVALPGYVGVYELSDHLGNVRATISDQVVSKIVNNIMINDVQILGYTDYYIGGWEMPGRKHQSAQRYRSGYQGQFTEQDPETGFVSFELRGYDPRKMRWDAPDPYGQYHSPYLAMGNSWANNTDQDGGYDGPDTYQPGSCNCSMDIDGVRTTYYSSQEELGMLKSYEYNFAELNGAFNSSKIQEYTPSMMEAWRERSENSSWYSPKGLGYNFFNNLWFGAQLFGGLNGSQPISNLGGDNMGFREKEQQLGALPITIFTFKSPSIELPNIKLPDINPYLSKYIRKVSSTSAKTGKTYNSYIIFGKRITAESHFLTPVKGAGRGLGNIQKDIFHINIGDFHIIPNPKYWGTFTNFGPFRW